MLQAIGPDKAIRAVKMVNSVGLDGQINRDELRYDNNNDKNNDNDNDIFIFCDFQRSFRVEAVD